MPTHIHQKTLARIFIATIFIVFPKKETTKMSINS